MKILLICLFLIMLPGCTRHAPAVPARAPQTAIKGMELYSWKTADDTWRFSLLPGTNRTKTLNEIEAPSHTIANVPGLKSRLASLAPGEIVIWHNLAKAPVPPNLAAELKAYCRKLNINLEITSFRGIDEPRN